MAYLFSHEEKKERERLAAIEAMGDPFTIECLEKIGVGEGWRCLEIGAGGGSIAEWLCGRVGPSGKVVATDLQTKLLEAIETSNLEVRKHDITKGDLEQETFDLVSARKVLEHLPQPTQALSRFAAAVRPGGWWGCCIQTRRRTASGTYRVPAVIKELGNSIESLLSGVGSVSRSRRFMQPTMPK